MTLAAIVMGGSAGSDAALAATLGALPANLGVPVLLVRHLHPSDAGGFAEHLAALTALPVVEPCDKDPIRPGHLYTAPANYHLLIDAGERIALSVDAPVKGSRPSIDVLFDSAARRYGGNLAAVLLSGASTDGLDGLRAVRAAAGLSIVQDPATAPHPLMPSAAIQAGVADEILTPDGIGPRLLELAAGID